MCKYCDDSINTFGSTYLFVDDKLIDVWFRIDLRGEPRLVIEINDVETERILKIRCFPLAYCPFCGRKLVENE